MNAMNATEGQLNETTALAFVNGEVMRDLRLDPRLLEVGLVIASQHMQRGQIEEALRAYTSLVILNPLDIEAHIGLATCALRMERPDAALRSASLVIGRAAKDPRGYLLSAQALLMLREADAAGRDARMALDLVDQSDLAPAIRAQVSALAVRIGNALSTSGSETQ